MLRDLAFSILPEPVRGSNEERILNWMIAIRLGSHEVSNMELELDKLKAPVTGGYSLLKTW